VYLKGDRKNKKAHKKSHHGNMISFQKLASIIGMIWCGLTDKGTKKLYFELAKEDQGWFRCWQQESK
jgi:hypothetical protein